MAPQIVAENPRVQELMAAIEAIQANRRQADQDLFQVHLLLINGSNPFYLTIFSIILYCL
jgi:hypothetical protein